MHINVFNVQWQQCPKSEIVTKMSRCPEISTQSDENKKLDQLSCSFSALRCSVCNCNNWLTFGPQSVNHLLEQRLSVCLSVCLPVCLSVCLSVCLVGGVSVYLAVSVCLTIWPPISISLSVSLLPVCLLRLHLHTTRMYVPRSGRVGDV